MLCPRRRAENLEKTREKHIGNRSCRSGLQNIDSNMATANGPSSPTSSPAPASPVNCHSPNNNNSFSSKTLSCGPKFKLINEGDIQVCRLNHTRTIVSKIMNSKYLRRWESHHLMLSESEIKSTTVSGTLIY